MRFLVFLVMIALIAAAGPASAQRGGGPRFDAGACDPRYCEESDWIYDDARSDHTTVWRHRMRATPRFVQILFTPDPDRGPVMPLIWPWQWQTTGNPQGIEMNNNAIRLHIWSGAPMHGIWRPGKGWATYREGYWKFIVYR